jgi:hypothetical protein
MTDYLVQMGLSNACFSLVLAIIAVAVGAKAKRPYLAHLLWLLVFVKLVTPPIVTIPIGVPALAADKFELPPGVDVPLDARPLVTAQPVGRLCLAAGKPLHLGLVRVSNRAIQPSLAEKHSTGAAQLADGDGDDRQTIET